MVGANLPCREREDASRTPLGFDELRPRAGSPSSELKGVGEVVGAPVALFEWRQTPARLDEFEDGDRLVLGVVDEPLLRERRDDDRRNPLPRPPTVNDRRGDVIPAPAVLVVG